jgi:hypothetical protein
MMLYWIKMTDPLDALYGVILAVSAVIALEIKHRRLRAS